MILVLKLVLTPLLIALATLAGRRWGPGVSGWLVGLPLTSGPVSLILALQDGPQFAAASAVGVLGGLASVCVFAVVYARCAPRMRWPASAALSVAAFFLAAALCDLARLSLWPALALTVAAICAAIALIRRPPAVREAPAPPAWDLPARMVVAAAFVLGLTSAAATLGPVPSGLLSPFPIFSLVLAGFSHRSSGPAAAVRLLRGVAIGSFGFAAFFLTIALCGTLLPIWLAYTLAAAAAVGVNGLSLKAVR